MEFRYQNSVPSSEGKHYSDLLTWHEILSESPYSTKKELDEELIIWMARAARIEAQTV